MNRDKVGSEKPQFDSKCITKGGKDVNYRFAWTIEKFSERREFLKNGEVINLIYYRIELKHMPLF